MAKNKPTKTTIAQGIYQDAHGISVIARVGSGKAIRQSPPVRFPLVDSDGIPYSKKNCAELIKCFLQLREDLKRQRTEAGGDAGSLGAAIDAWKIEFPIPTAKGTEALDDLIRRRKNDHALVAHWRKATIAATPADAIKRSQVRAQLDAWSKAGAAASSVNHRKQALTTVLRWSLGVDDDSDIVLPTTGIPNLAGPAVEPRGLLMPVLVYIINSMPDRGRAAKGEDRPEASQTKTRLRIMAWSGLAHASLRRLERRHVNFREHKMWLPIRKKGGGAKGVWVDAMPQAIEALRDYDRLGLWGRKFSESSMRKSWGVAIDNAREALEVEAEKTGDRTMLEQFIVTVPPNCRPYDTRHSFLSDVYRQTGDIKAVKGLGQHASIKTSERYTEAAVPERIATAIDKMRSRWCPDVAKPGATVRDFHVVK